MAHHLSAKKRIRSSEKRRVRNKAASAKLKTLMKKVQSTQDKAKAEENLKEAVSFLDKSANKRLLHRNNINRKKAALSRHVNSLKAAE